MANLGEDPNAWVDNPNLNPQLLEALRLQQLQQQAAQPLAGQTLPFDGRTPSVPYISGLLPH